MYKKQVKEEILLYYFLRGGFSIKDITRNKKIKKSVIFIIYILISLFLLIKHEPWRDEIHAWLMSKTYTIPELYKISRIEGHPILWHLLLIPLAKFNFNIIWLNVFNYIIVIIGASFYYFKKDNISLIFKSITLFTIPFMYVYSSFARNYSLILLLLMLIAFYYKDRYNKPILYSFLISLLIHTHIMAWGIVAGLTITFHVTEIIKYLKRKENNCNVEKIIFGFFIIVINTIFVCVELYSIPNSNFMNNKNYYYWKDCAVILFLTIAILINNIIIYKTIKSELIVLLLSYFFMFFIMNYYSIVIIQRSILIYLYLLFYINIVDTNKETDKKNIKNTIYLYFIIFIIFHSFSYFQFVYKDIKMNYSSAKEMAYYINNNIPENEELLTIFAPVTQTIIPYSNNSQYDIIFNYRVDCGNNISYDEDVIKETINNIKEYNKRYLIITKMWINYIPNYCELVYQTTESVIDEQYYLYYINYK